MLTWDQSDIQHWAACQHWEEPSWHLPGSGHLSPAGTWFCKNHLLWCLQLNSQEISACTLKLHWNILTIHICRVSLQPWGCQKRDWDIYQHLLVLLSYASRGISKEWAERKLWKGEEWEGESTAPQPSSAGGSMLGLESSLHSSMTSQPFAALATSKKDALSMMIYTNNQIPKFTGGFLPFMCCLWCRSLPVQVQQQPWPKAWCQSSWRSQLCLASAGRHDSKGHMKNPPRAWKILLDPLRRPGSSNCLLLTAERHKLMAALQLTTMSLASSLPLTSTFAFTQLRINFITQC